MMISGSSFMELAEFLLGPVKKEMSWGLGVLRMSTGKFILLTALRIALCDQCAYVLPACFQQREVLRLAAFGSF